MNGHTPWPIYYIQRSRGKVRAPFQLFKKIKIIFNFNLKTTFMTLSFQRKPESSQNDLEAGYFDSMVIGGLLDAGSSPA